MAKTTEKKIVLVIVEGQTDADALTACLEDVFAGENVAVEITRCDLTTEPGVDSYNIRGCVGEVVKRYLTRNHYIRKGDLWRVIHLVDTDGTFVPSEVITEDKTLRGPVYSENGISTHWKKGLEARNKQKSKALRALVKTNFILDVVPYRVFFMSCNLEHVLHNRMNCTIEEKEQLAYQFAKQYFGNVEGFKAFFEDPVIAVQSNYAESWRTIEKGLESLRRHTNLGLSWTETSWTIKAPLAGGNVQGVVDCSTRSSV